MNRKLLLGILVLSMAVPAWPASKEIIQLQRDVALLQDMVRDLNRTMTERLAVMTQLVERNTDTTNKLGAALENVQRSLANALAAQGQKVDAGHQQVQALSESLEDLKARQSKMSEQLAQIRQLLETIQSQPQPSAPAVQPAAQAAAPAPPPNPKDLYENALRDLQGGKNDLAMAGFTDYLKYFPETDLAGNAQFYIGEVHYRKGEYDKAIDAYNAVLDNYPKNNKAATAHWKKAQALLEQKQRDAAVRELRTLIRRFPNSDEAKLARDRLKALGLTADARAPTSTKAARKKTRR